MALDRPFDPAVSARAEALAGQYGFLIQPHPDVSYLARGLELPTVFADGKTAERCATAIREALTVAVATMLEMGQAPPAPAAEAVRREQVNIRLTAEEKLRLEEAARAKGFRGISDFVRSTALASAR